MDTLMQKITDGLRRPCRECGMRRQVHARTCSRRAGKPKHVPEANRG